MIIGAGPTGLGAAYRLHELGYDNWVLYEKSSDVGGHASSHVDKHGFVWDEGVTSFFRTIPISTGSSTRSSVMRFTSGFAKAGS